MDQRFCLAIGLVMEKMKHNGAILGSDVRSQAPKEEYLNLWNRPTKVRMRMAVPGCYRRANIKERSLGGPSRRGFPIPFPIRILTLESLESYQRQHPHPPEPRYKNDEGILLAVLGLHSSSMRSAVLSPRKKQTSGRSQDTRNLNFSF